MTCKLTVPDNPTPQQLQHLLAICSNQIATLSDQVATYKQDAAIKMTNYKRELARAIVRYSGSGTASFIKAKAETDSLVVSALDDVDIAEAVYGIAKAELDGYDAQFIALRKIAEIRKQEIKSLSS